MQHDQIDESAGMVDGETALAIQAQAHPHGGAEARLFTIYEPRARHWALRLGVLETHLDDAQQEGLIGLLKALRRFDPRRGVPFGAYATIQVKGAIMHFRDRERRQVRILVKADAVRDAQPAPNDALTAVLATEATGMVRAATVTLGKPATAALFREFWLDEAPVSIARDRGVSRAAVTQGRARALARVRVQLAAEAPDDFATSG